jgi:hypothetical protein
MPMKNAVLNSLAALFLAVALEGNWHADSTCVAKGTACRDEKVVYHFAKIPGKDGYFSVTADKIVNGNAIAMGTLEFRHDPDKNTLVC